MDEQPEILQTGFTLDQLRERYPRPRKPRGEARPLISAALYVEGWHLDAVEFSHLVGLSATSFSAEAPHRGTWLPSGQPNLRKPFWCYELSKRPSLGVDDVVANLLAELWPQRRTLREAIERQRLEAGFPVNVTIFKERPVYSLSPVTLKRLAYFKVEFLLDIFDYS